jgi:hypothetical protein
LYSDFTNNATRGHLKVTQEHKSSNDREDFIQIQLKRYLIALQILEQNNLIEEFRRAVRSPHLSHAEALCFGEEVAIKEKQAAGIREACRVGYLLKSGSNHMACIKTSLERLKTRYP